MVLVIGKHFKISYFFGGNYRRGTKIYLVMEMMLKKVWLFLVPLLLLMGCLSRPKPRVGDFNAVVIDTLTREGIPSVAIFVGKDEYTTDLKGQFSLASLEPGDYQIRMSRQWYESKEFTYKHLGKPVPVIFHLRPESLSGRIYYSFDEGRNKEIYGLILEDRAVNQVLSLLESGETNPAWSRSGKFAVESTADNISKVKVYDLAMGDHAPILIQDGEHPSIDNEGEYMVFKSNGKIVKYDIDRNKEIETYDLAGWNPVISPDGTRVAYVSGDFTKLYIYISKTECDVFVPKGEYDGYKLNNPCWSHDGNKIAFEAYENSEGKRGIYYIDVNSTNPVMTQITFPSGDKEQHKHPTWGEDDMIYFSGNMVYSSRSDIYGVRLDDSPKWIMVSKGPGNKLYPCWGSK